MIRVMANEYAVVVILIRNFFSEDMLQHEGSKCDASKQHKSTFIGEKSWVRNVSNLIGPREENCLWCCGIIYIENRCRWAIDQDSQNSGRLMVESADEGQ